VSVGSGAPLGSYGSGNLIGVWDQSNLRVYPWCSQEMLGGARPSEKQRVFLVLEWGLHAPFLCCDPVQGAKYKGIVVFPRCSQGLARINLVGVDFCSALSAWYVSTTQGNTCIYCYVLDGFFSLLSMLKFSRCSFMSSVHV
jgi:hypothetical protein